MREKGVETRKHWIKLVVRWIKKKSWVPAFCVIVTSLDGGKKRRLRHQIVPLASFVQLLLHLYWWGKAGATAVLKQQVWALDGMFYRLISGNRAKPHPHNLNFRPEEAHCLLSLSHYCLYPFSSFFPLFIPVPVTALWCQWQSSEPLPRSFYFGYSIGRESVRLKHKGTVVWDSPRFSLSQQAGSFLLPPSVRFISLIDCLQPLNYFSFPHLPVELLLVLFFLPLFHIESARSLNRILILSFGG